MSSITLAEAQTQLAASMQALERARNSTGYNVADRSLQRDKVDALQKQVAIWQRKVDELTAAQQGARSPGMIFPKWR